MNEHEVQIFTVEEANELIPILSELVAELYGKRDEVAQVELEIDAYELVAGRSRSKNDPEFERFMARHRLLADQFYTIVDEIHSYGCYLKDVDLGLIDFHGMLDDRMVFWCWRFGEEKIAFWHEIQEGYAGRKPLEEGEHS